MKRMQVIRPLLLALAAAPALAAPNWFTVAGDPLDPEANTVQVNPVADGADPRRMQVRVSRALPRISWDGVPYRSYRADVLFNCKKSTARYLSIHYYLEPRWLGTPQRVVDYATGEPRLMEFREMEPNPMARIIAAACATLPRSPAAAP